MTGINKELVQNLIPYQQDISKAYLPGVHHNQTLTSPIPSRIFENGHGQLFTNLADVDKIRLRGLNLEHLTENLNS